MQVKKSSGNGRGTLEQTEYTAVSHLTTKRKKKHKTFILYFDLSPVEGV